MKYDFKKVEEKWQSKWFKNNTFRAVNFDARPKYYALMEFPFPSAKGIHMGNVRCYIPQDVNARYHRFKGENVLYPIGYDAFGLPAENYALSEGIHPREATKNNIKNFEQQFKKLGFSFDWDRVIDTTDPNYYKWTQLIFIKLFEKGLAYKNVAFVNYCPKCKVVLSNEDSQGGKCDRCGSSVEQRQRDVWFLKITDYAEKMLKLLDEVDYSESVKTAQRNWIGKSEGAIMKFKIKANEKQADIGEVEVFTTRPDTIFGATFMVLSPENPIIDNIKNNISNWKEIEKYRDEIKTKNVFERTEMNRDKTGVKLESISAINPLSGDEVPLFISDYVVMGYGTGAIMAVPAHDERDFEFAKKFGIKIIKVISNSADKNEEMKEAYIGDGTLINSQFLNGMTVENAKKAVIEYIETNKIGTRKINYKMQDWAFNRQRYWGEPIPIIYCEKCGAVAVKKSELPLILPETDDYQPNEAGDSPLAKIDSFVNVECPKCGGKAKRETDTMPQWAGSSWYWLRYCDPKNDLEFADNEKLKYWGQVDLYTGGSEHVTRHMIYAQFWNLFLYDIGFIPERVPFKKRICAGLLLGSDGAKMSKSKGNSVNPLDILNEYPCDALRVHLCFMGDFEKTVTWSDDSINGSVKFIKRVWDLLDIVKDDKTATKYSKEHNSALNLMIKKTTEMYESFSHNTIVSELMKFVNIIYDDNFITKNELKDFLIVLCPLAPHIASEMFEIVFKGDINEQPFPTYDEKALVLDEISLPIQINGKYKKTITLPTDTEEKDAIKLIKESTNLLDDKEIKKVIFLKNKIINIITAK
ncbi:MAG: leucine--tRNA ligase [Clostridia bacterium]|nr:leucine--tRNA ligase [Clostridia bacterium]MDD4408398.1 leucine--tRNA ligase [Clostridia bacterium]